MVPLFLLEKVFRRQAFPALEKLDSILSTLPRAPPKSIPIVEVHGFEIQQIPRKQLRDDLILLFLSRTCVHKSPIIRCLWIIYEENSGYFLPLRPQEIDLSLVPVPGLAKSECLWVPIPPDGVEIRELHDSLVFGLGHERVSSLDCIHHFLPDLQFLSVLQFPFLQRRCLAVHSLAPSLAKPVAGYLWILHHSKSVCVSESQIELCLSMTLMCCLGVPEASHLMILCNPFALGVAHSQSKLCVCMILLSSCHVPF
mmetsp:Transcript_21409/g.33488  ORF Transcript_21409/g.33488 Transcript_21409/m.33488 type:complete len:255 (+) Transcript_21409:689-1453(+)